MSERGTKQSRSVARRARRAHRAQRRPDTFERPIPRTGVDLVSDTRLSSELVKPKSRESTRAMDLWGHVGYVLIAVGSLFIANQSPIGYLIHVPAVAIWIVLGIKLRMTSIWAWEILCGVTVIYGYLNWTDRLPLWIGW